MYVVATAGHVDHGKSTLVRALTGMEPDRWAEERRRGLTIDLGFAWTPLTDGEQVAFVDVPGHERFVTNMLAGVGPAPAVMLVVAADEGWKPQSEEHLQAVAALGTTALLAVATKCDVASPDAALAQARERVLAAGLPAPAQVAVSAATGEGLDALRMALAQLVRSLPKPDEAAPVRLWVDRAFTIRGAGTVVTGTLAAGHLRVGDELALLPAGRPVVVRALQSLNTEHTEVGAVARVAVNLRGVDRDDVARGMALVTAGAWTTVDEVDVVADTTSMPAQVVVHIGAAAVPAQLRPLSPSAARIRLATALPLHLGDRLLLRDPASRRLVAADVADAHPHPLHRRGDAARVASELRVPVSADDVVSRRGVCHADELRAAGLPDPPEQAKSVGGWWVHPTTWDEWRDQLQAKVADTDSLSAGVPVQELRRELRLPDDGVVTALVTELPDLHLVDGRVRPAAAPVVEVPGLDQLLRRLADDPLDAPDTSALAELRLGPPELAHATRAGLLLKVADGIYVAPTAPDHAVTVLSELHHPFTVSEARELLGSTRRVVLPLLEHLDASRRTRRLPDGKRLLVARPA